ncbi:unnamed protein product [Cuscuta epithymum]|uniref:Uncharacterized protein n=1 Tax=Cuscuta epithymum TaxID=186058 RepID=A0AAV0D7W0_9ASTE|nr:unnamed protein product [Cuscuta epithymum]
MGGVCSRKRDQLVEDHNIHRGVPGHYCKSSSSKWLGSSSSRSSFNAKDGNRKCQSLMELCISTICEDIDKYNSFSMLPRDISQQIFDELVYSQSLNEVGLEAFRDCALQDVNLGEYPGLNDSWMDVIYSQGSSLLSVDLSASDVTDYGMAQLKDCKNLQELNFNYCDQISDRGLEHVCCLTSLTSLSLRRNNMVTAQGMSALSGLINLVKLDLERSPKIHGGLVYLRGLTKLESLNINCCNCITDSDIKSLTVLKNLKVLQVASNKVTDYGVTFLRALNKLTLLNMEGCPITAACLESLSALGSLLYLNLSRCHLTDDGCDKFSGIPSLKVLNLGFNGISDAIFIHLKGGFLLCCLYRQSM